MRPKIIKAIEHHKALLTEHGFFFKTVNESNGQLRVQMPDGNLWDIFPTTSRCRMVRTNETLYGLETLLARFDLIQKPKTVSERLTEYQEKTFKPDNNEFSLFVKYMVSHYPEIFEEYMRQMEEQNSTKDSGSTDDTPPF